MFIYIRSYAAFINNLDRLNLSILYKINSRKYVLKVEVACMKHMSG